jgi:hypothetical protein
MTLFYDLKAMFGPPWEVDPWGLCIVIQAPEFKPDWEATLADLGYECHFEKLDDHPVVFVPLKKAAWLETNVFVLEPNVTSGQSEASKVSTKIDVPVKIDEAEVLIDLIGKMADLTENFCLLRKRVIDLEKRVQITGAFP